MNKIKVIYDAVKQMKSRDALKGSLKVEGVKDQQKVLEVDHTFEKSNQGFQVKGKTLMEVEKEGNRVMMENNIDFKKEGSFRAHEHRGHMHHFHSFRQQAHGTEGGMRFGWNKLTAVLGLLSSVNLEEDGEGTVKLSLASADIPEEMKREMKEMMKQGHEHHKHMAEGHPHSQCLKEFHDMEEADFDLVVWIGKNREINEISLAVAGKTVDENKNNHDARLTANMCFQ